MKIVLDSNILVAAFATRGLCSSLLELCLDRHEIIISRVVAKLGMIDFPPAAGENARPAAKTNYILMKCKLSRKIKLPRDKVEAVVKYLKEFCEVNGYTRIAGGVCRDKKDDDIIAFAVSNRVRYLITGDDDLLSLKKYEEVEIVSPRVFWARVKMDKG